VRRALSQEDTERISVVRTSIGATLRSFYQREVEQPVPERIVVLLREIDQLDCELIHNRAENGPSNNKQ